MAAVSPARKIAFGILIAVTRGRGHSDDLLRSVQVEKLDPADRNLATALVLGVLRWQIWLDEQIRPLLKRPNARLDPEVSIALRLGAFQLFFLDRIPDHAAIDESVELAKQAGHRFASGMVNAVLRNLARNQAGHPAAEPQTTAELALQFAHPLWLVERWVAVYGLAATQAICRHGQEQPPLTLRLASADVEPEFNQTAISLGPGSLLAAARAVLSGDVQSTAALRDGRVRFQDEGSQLIAELAAAALPGPGNILDACAAPGGKTMILAERHLAANILACDASEKRLGDLRKRLAPFGSRIQCVHADAATLGSQSSCDLVLADVPCSGTGTLGRNPEIRHRLKPEDLGRHAERQQAILRAALHALKPGGRVLYSTCSLEREENEEVVATVRDSAEGAKQISLAPVIDRLTTSGILTPAGCEIASQCLSPEGSLRLLPGNVPTDGFFAALLEKTN